LEVPGPVDFGGDIGLPPKTAYACLAETLILTLEGRYECFTLGRDISLEGVKEIYKMGLKHGFKLAAIRGHKGIITDQEIAFVRAKADEVRARKGLPSMSEEMEEAPATRTRTKAKSVAKSRSRVAAKPKAAQ